MNKLFLIPFISMAAASLSAAETDAKREASGAAKKLGDQANYAWISTPKAEGSSVAWRQGPTEGKAEKAGYTYAKFELGDNTIEFAFKGAKAAIKIDGDWRSTDELEGDQAWIADRLKVYKAPAAEAADLVTKAKELKNQDGGLYSADLTEAGAKEVIARGRRGQGDGPKGAKGSVKFWLKDGALVKYEFNVQGKITRDGNEVELNRTTTVEIKDVGTTKVIVPEEAKKKLP